MLMLWYPKCSTCQKAKAWLDERNLSCTVRDIKTENPTAEELCQWHAASGLPLKRFFNTSGLQYKALGTDGMLVKRPILVGDGFVLTGFRPKEWEERLG